MNISCWQHNSYVEFGRDTEQNIKFSSDNTFKQGLPIFSRKWKITFTSKKMSDNMLRRLHFSRGVGVPTEVRRSLLPDRTERREGSPLD